MELDDLKSMVLKCRKCPLYKFRTNPVVGSGSTKKGIMLVGEAPGKKEDETGLPFVGKAGKVLNELLSKAGLKRDDVYITNIVKCRPPNNRDPTEEEINACKPYLDIQFAIIKPKVLITLGRYSMEHFQKKFGLPRESISRCHGMHYKIRTLHSNLLFVPMYHPAASLYSKLIKERSMNDWEELGKAIGKYLK